MANHFYFPGGKACDRPQSGIAAVRVEPGLFGRLWQWCFRKVLQAFNLFIFYLRNAAVEQRMEQHRSYYECTNNPNKYEKAL